MKPDWKINRHERGDLWKTNNIALHAEGINYFTQARDRMAVKKNPVFKPIPVTHYITPILNINIGKGDNILEHFINEIQEVA